MPQPVAANAAAAALLALAGPGATVDVNATVAVNAVVAADFVAANAVVANAVVATKSRRRSHQISPCQIPTVEEKQCAWPRPRNSTQQQTYDRNT
jgi:hypothetical protein